MKLFIKLCILIFGLTGTLAADDTIDLVIFSKNRPLQLYALLESCEWYLSGVQQLSVIYYADEQFKAAYAAVAARFAGAHFIEQAQLGARGDFKNLTLRACCATDAAYLVFAVDDIVVIDTVDLRRCAQLLEQYNAYGFYLRLGTDITECYMERRHTGQPPLQLLEHDVYRWQFHTGSGDWGYPHTVDMTLFRKEDIEPFLTKMSYHSPNTLEGHWAGYAGSVMKQYGLCFERSKMVNFPLNLVQVDWTANRHSDECDVHFLLEKFYQGLKMDISVLHQFPHKAPHAEYKPTFIAR